MYSQCFITYRGDVVDSLVYFFRPAGRVANFETQNAQQGELEVDSDVEFIHSTLFSDSQVAAFFASSELSPDNPAIMGKYRTLSPYVVVDLCSSERVCSSGPV